MEIFKLYGSVLIDTSKAMTSMQKLVGEADKVGTKLGNSFKTFGSSLTQIGDKMTALGGKLTTTLTLPLATIGTKALNTAKEVDKTMQLVKSTMGATTDEAKKLDDAIEKAAKNSTLTVNDAATAMLNFARQGWDAEDAISLLEPAMALAVGTGTDLDTVSSGLGNTIKAFGLEAKDSAKVTDLLAKAQASANTTTSGLLDAIEIAGPIFKTAGWDLDDLATVTGIFGDHSISASEGATALKTGVARLTSPTKQASIWLDRMGITVSNTDGTMKDFRTVIGDLHDGFENLTESEKLQAAAAIFGKNQMSKWLVLIEAGAETFDTLNEKILENEGYCQQLSDSLMSGLGGTLERLKATWDVFLKNVGDSLGRVIKPVVEWLIKLLDKFNELSDEEQDQIVKIGLIVAAAGPLLMLLGTLCSVLGNIISFAGTLINVIAKVPGLVGNIGAALGKIPSLLSSIGSLFTSTFGAIGMIIAGAVTAVSSFVSMWQNGWSVIKTILEALGIALAAIGAVILGAPAAVAAVIAAIVFAVSQLAIVIHDHWDEIKAWAQETWDSIKQGFSNLIEGIKDGWNQIVEFLQGIGETIKNIGSSICEAVFGSIESLFSNTIKAVNHWFNSTFGDEGVVSGIPDIINSLLDTIIVMVMSAVGTIGDTIQGLFNALVDLFTGNFEKLKEDLWLIVLNVKSRLTDVYIEVYSFVVIVWETIRDFLKNGKDAIFRFFENIKDKGVTFFKNAKDKIGTFVENAISKIISLKDDAIKFVKEMFDNIQKKAKAAFDWIKEKASTFFDNAVKKVGSFIEDVQGKVKDFKDKVISTLKDIFDEAKKKFDAMITLIIDKIKEIIGVVRQKIDDIVTTVNTKIEDIITAVKTKIANLIRTVTQKLGEVATAIYDGLKNILDKAQAMLERIWDAVKNFAGQVKDNVMAFGQFIVDKISSFGSAMFEAGKALFQKLWDGIKAIWTGISSWISEKVSGVTNAISGVVSKVRDAANDLTGGAVDRMSEAIDSLRGIKQQQIIQGSYAEGLPYVPYDGFVAELHQGERVLTKQENQEYSSGGSSDTIRAINNLTEMVARNMMAQQQLLSNLNFNVNGREFARLVKAVE